MKKVVFSKPTKETTYFWKYLRGGDWITLYPLGKKITTKELAYVQLSEYFFLYPESQGIEWLLCSEVTTVKRSVVENINPKMLKEAAGK